MTADLFEETQESGTSELTDSENGSFVESGFCYEKPVAQTNCGSVCYLNAVVILLRYNGGKVGEFLRTVKEEEEGFLSAKNGCVCCRTVTYNMTLNRELRREGVTEQTVMDVAVVGISKRKLAKAVKERMREGRSADCRGECGCTGRLIWRKVKFSHHSFSELIHSNNQIIHTQPKLSFSVGTVVWDKFSGKLLQAPNVQIDGLVLIPMNNQPTVPFSSHS